MSRRRAILAVTHEALTALLRTWDGVTALTAEPPLPPDVRVVGAFADEANGRVLLCLESATFAEVPEGGTLPYVEHTALHPDRDRQAAAWGVENRHLRALLSDRVQDSDLACRAQWDERQACAALADAAGYPEVARLVRERTGERERFERDL